MPSIFSGKRSANLNLASPKSGQQHAHNRTLSVASSSSAVRSPIVSPDATDRVFPMRSFVSVDPTPTPSSRAGSEPHSGYFPDMASRRQSSHRTSSTNTLPSVTPGPGDSGSSEVCEGDERGSRKSSAGQSSQYWLREGEQFKITTDDASLQSGTVGAGTNRGRSVAAASATSRRSLRDLDDPGPLVTARFKHVVTEEGHAVITGRDGETLQRCEDEPIHIPGAVQSFGVLIALEEESEGKFIVRVASENSRRFLGYSPQQLFALESFTDILSEEQTENLLDHIDFIKDEGSDPETTGPEVFTITVRDSKRKSRKLWCAIHVNRAHPNLIICEFELEDDPDFPLVPPNDKTPEPPEDTLSSDPTEEELRESTETKSRPLRVLRSARKRKGEAAAMEVFNVMSQVQEQLAEAPNLDAFLKVLVGVVKELTGFHRVMIYQFDATWNGKVVTELVDPRATKDLYKGLHFPASDIPKQARDLYRINKVRLLYDRDQETSRLVCRTTQDLETPLDLTHSYLRAMSPIHTKYLANMAVRSSMSISINAFNELWGLISCHAYGSQGTRVSFAIRKMCRVVGDTACRNIERLSYAARLQARKLINTAPTSANPSGYIIATSDDLLKLFNADFGMLSIHGETKVLGKLEATQEALAMLEYLRVRSFTSVLTTTDLREEFPDLRYPPGFKTLAGLLLVPLSAGGADFIVFFRRGHLREVKWAGNPYEKYVKEGTEGFLEPRKSFKVWSETVVGKCREWSEQEIETAAVLCLVYGKFIEVWRQKEAALENSQLTKLLLANSAHEVRTPLNAIINYLEIAMEGSLDSETRDNLARSHSASKSLVYVINDLLDLTRTESGLELVREETMDLPATFREAVDLFRGEANRKGIEYDIRESTHLPTHVYGDQRRIRQAVTNLVANAFEATKEGSVKVEISSTRQEDGTAHVEVVVEDTGIGMTSTKLDSLFVELEQVQAENKEIIEETIAPDANKLVESKESSSRALGLGLAVVARVVKNVNGQLRVKSEEGKGSRFVILLPFDLPESEGRLLEQEASVSGSEKGLSDAFQGRSEVTLIGMDNTRRGSASSSSSSSRGVSRKNSNNSMNSFNSRNSFKSGKSGKSFASQQSGKSDVDRLIEAMQEPHMVEGPPASKPGSRKSHRSPTGHISWGGESGPARTKSLDQIPSSPGQVTAVAGRSLPATPGRADVEGSSQPIRAVRVPDDESAPEHVPAKAPSVISEPVSQASTEASVASTSVLPDCLRVLVAEDDPINSKIVQKRMQKAGHDVYMTVNGEECASAYGDAPGSFDVVLMDMQVCFSVVDMTYSLLKKWSRCPSWTG